MENKINLMLYRGLPHTGCPQTDLQNTLNELERNGFIFDHEGYGQIKYTIDCSSKNLHNALIVTSMIAEETKITKHMFDSYGDKHVVEKCMKSNYITNGEFILICLTLGFHIKYIDNLNIKFKAKFLKSKVLYKL